jgi:hypothetical protein
MITHVHHARWLALALLALQLAIVPTAAETASVTVSATIAPIPLSAELATTPDAVVLTVMYYDGGQAGWSVGVTCDCELVPLGPVETVKGIPANWRDGPVFADGSLRAAAPGGQGVYRQRFAPAAGLWQIAPVLDDPAAAGNGVTMSFTSAVAVTDTSPTH